MGPTCSLRLACLLDFLKLYLFNVSPNKKHMRNTSWQAMVTNLHGKKVRTHHGHEVRYVFTPTEQSYNNNLKEHFTLDKL
jgi:hypothetical protein